MSSTHNESEDLATSRELIARLCDGRLDREGAALLESLVCGSAEVRRLYVLTVSLHADLYLQSAFLSHRQPPGGEALDDEGAAPSLHDVLIAPAIKEVSPSVRTPRLAMPRPAGRPVQPPRSPWLQARWAAVAALVGGAIWISMRSSGHPDHPVVAIAPDSKPADPPVAVPTPPVPLPAEPLARLDLSLHPVWAGASPPSGHAIRPGDALHLKSGLAQLVMRSGTSVILEGPSDIVVEADHQVRLTRGRLTARSPHPTNGFAVVTPTATVTDVGTEFAVATADGPGTGSSHTDVVVLDGVIRVDPAGSVGAGQTLHAPQACAVTHQGVQVVAKSAAGPFVRQADFARRKAVVASAAAANRHPDLLLCWPGEPDLDRQPVVEGGPIGVRWRAATATTVRARGEYAAFLDLDTASTGRLALHGFVGPDGRVGVAGKTLYLSWMGTSDRPSPSGYGGLVLADGDRGAADDVLFVGQVSGSPSFSCRAASGAVVPIDGDPSTPGTQAVVLDRKAHLWVVRVDFGATGGRAAVYLDPRRGAEPSAANAVVDAGQLRFDRVRMVWGPHDYWVFKRLLTGSSFASVTPG